MRINGKNGMRSEVVNEVKHCKVMCNGNDYVQTLIN